MSQAVLRRARNLMLARSGSLAGQYALAVVQSLLTLLLVAIGGLLLGLAASRGVSRFDEAQLSGAERSEVPSWLSDRLPTAAPGQTLLQGASQDLALSDTGLYPLVQGAHNSTNGFVRGSGQLLMWLMERLRPLRDNRGALFTLLLFGLLVILALSAISQARRQLAIRAVGRATNSLRNQIHRQTYRLGQSSLPAQGLGPVVTLFSRDVNEVRDGLFAELLHGVLAPILAIGLVGMSLFLSPSLTIFVLTLAGLVALASVPLQRAAQAEADTAARESAVHLLQLHEDLSMLRTVRVFGMESVDKQRFDEHLAHFQQADERRMRIEGALSPALILLIGAAALLALGMVCHAVETGRIGLTSALILLALALGLVWPAYVWLKHRRALDRASHAARRVFEFIDRKPELQMNVGAQFLAPIRERIKIDHVSIDGPNGRTLLHDLSATVRAGTRTALLGLDDDSKHALVCLIPRLIDPRKGRVTIDGIDLREVTLESLRAQISLVLQADYVFSDSVVNNIGLGDSSFTLPGIIEASKIAHAHNFVQQLPQGYETVIGPLGHPLSPDEQFRIALARAYLHDPSIVVIEEPSTPLDDDVKPLIDDTIDRLAKGRTLIFLPHRLSTIRKCDQVIVIHNGHVEAQGPPSEVSDKSKLFRHIQYVEFNQFASGEIEAGQMGVG
jgi:ABC-type multidrug transport system fused ATPase/permease subunit